MKSVKNKIFVLVLLVVWGADNVMAQEELDFSGFVSVMPSMAYVKSQDKTSFDFLVHNRINLGYQINDKLNSKISFRNRLFWGETVESTPIFKHLMTNDPGFLDLSFNWESRSNYLLNTNIDRLWVEYVSGDFQAKVGRQRVNWSKTMIWNPNDIFNSYSYFDFDYVERPGMDGLRLQYFTGVNSNLEAVLKVNRDNDITAAALYRSTVLGYDVQLISGIIEKSDWIVGCGWGGDILGAGFYGEASYLIDREEDSKNQLLLAVGANYMLKNSLLLSTEYFYMENKGGFSGDYTSLVHAQRSIKNLSIDKHSYMLSVSWPVNPLLNISMSYMGFGFPAFDKFYLGPTVDYSVNDNLSFSAVSQYFSFEGENESLGIYLRLKWCF